MSTKNNPGPFPCYQNADPDEEMFVLLGRDPTAGTLVRAWAAMCEATGGSAVKVTEAYACAARLDAHAESLGKGARVRLAGEVLIESLFHVGITSDAPKDHVDHFIDDHKQDPYARFVLMYMRFPAAWQIDFRPFWKDKKLFCTYKEERWRVTMASRFGHIGLSKQYHQEDGYQETAFVTNCSEWSPGAMNMVQYRVRIQKLEAQLLSAEKVVEAAKAYRDCRAGGGEERQRRFVLLGVALDGYEYDNPAPPPQVDPTPAEPPQVDPTPAEPPQVDGATCGHRELLDTDEDWPTGPECGEPATHIICDPVGAKRCAKHKCRCNMPLRTGRAPQPDQQAAVCISCDGAREVYARTTNTGDVLFRPCPECGVQQAAVEADGQLSIVFVVNGEPVRVDVSPSVPLSIGQTAALTKSGNMGQPGRRWQLWDEYGRPINTAKSLDVLRAELGHKKLPPEAPLYLTLEIGSGGVESSPPPSPADDRIPGADHDSDGPGAKAETPAESVSNREGAAIPMRLPCPQCGRLHIDEGEFATKPHHTHSCQHCGLTWRPAVVPTVGVQFLPGFKNAAPPPPAQPDQQAVVEVPKSLDEIAQLLSYFSVPLEAGAHPPDWAVGPVKVRGQHNSWTFTDLTEEEATKLVALLNAVPGLIERLSEQAAPPPSAQADTTPEAADDRCVWTVVRASGHINLFTYNTKAEAEERCDAEAGETVGKLVPAQAATQAEGVGKALAGLVAEIGAAYRLYADRADLGGYELGLRDGLSRALEAAERAAQADAEGRR